METSFDYDDDHLIGAKLKLIPIVFGRYMIHTIGCRSVHLVTELVRILEPHANPPVVGKRQQHGSSRSSST